MRLKSSSPPLRQKKRRSWWALPIILLLLVVLAYVLVRRSGHWLVENDTIAHAKHVLVLDGQGADMERTTAAAKMLLDGKADTVWISGGRIFRDKNAGDFYVKDMLAQGSIDLSRVFLLAQEDHATIEEARSFLPLLKSRSMDTLVIITGTATTHRAKAIFQKLAGPKLVVLVADPGDQYFSADGWMNTRQGCKIWFREWLALAFSWLELPFVSAVEPESGKQYSIEPYGAKPSAKDEPALKAILEDAAVSSAEEISSSALQSSSSKEDRDAADSAKAKPEASAKSTAKEKSSVKAKSSDSKKDSVKKSSASKKTEAAKSSSSKKKDSGKSSKKAK